MSTVIVQLPLDRSGRAPNNLIGSEEHTLTTITGFPYKAIVMEHGGFYEKSLRVYDASYNKLKPNIDYIVTYVYKNFSESVGLTVAGLIVFLDKTRVGNVFCTAQMVGGNAAFSFTCIPNYIQFFNTQAAGYIPKWDDFVGKEYTWKPGELEQERWHLDTYQPFNNAIDDLTNQVMGMDGVAENDYRKKIDDDFNNFMGRFNERLDNHIKDMNNPHKDSRTSLPISLGLLQNYKVATDTEAVAGTSNQLYMTPYSTGLSIDEWALKPLQRHTSDMNNPHRVSVYQTGAITREQAQASADGLYRTDEQVANSNYIFWNGSNWSYDSLMTNFRQNIPAGNFVNGYLSPERIGSGVPGDTKVLMSNGIWTDFANLVINYPVVVNSTILYVTPPITYTPAQGHAYALSLPEALTLPVGSIIFYSLNYSYARGGHPFASITYNTDLILYGSIRTQNGWAQI